MQESAQAPLRKRASAEALAGRIKRSESRACQGRIEERRHRRSPAGARPFCRPSGQAEARLWAVLPGAPGNRAQPQQRQPAPLRLSSPGAGRSEGRLSSFHLIQSDDLAAMEKTADFRQFPQVAVEGSRQTGALDRSRRDGRSRAACIRSGLSADMQPRQVKATVSTPRPGAIDRRTAARAGTQREKSPCIGG